MALFHLKILAAPMKLTRFRSKTLAQVVVALIATGFLIPIPIFPASFFLSYGRAPCQEDNHVYIWMGLVGVPLGFATTALWLIAWANRMTWMRFFGVLALGLATAGIFLFARKVNSDQQVSCARRSLPEAMAFCAAPPDDYELWRNPDGNHVLFLLPSAPHNLTEMCLEQWSSYSEAVSFAAPNDILPSRNEGSPEGAGWARLPFDVAKSKRR
jgi:hypothetical protein